MQLPSIEACQSDPFLHQLRETDAKQFLSQKWGSNQRFESWRRIQTAIDLMKQYLPKVNDRSEIRLADFACGTANFGLSMAEDGYQVDLIDNEAKFFDFIKLKSSSSNYQCLIGDILSFKSNKPYHGIFLGEAIEHVAKPLEVLQNLYSNLCTGGVLCLTTPNGNFVNCYEPNWSEVKEQTERNEKIANTLGNHVCEFTMQELKDLVKQAGFCVLEHQAVVSDIVCRSNLLRRIPNQKLLSFLDSKFAKKPAGNQKVWGKIQIIVAQKAH